MYPLRLALRDESPAPHSLHAEGGAGRKAARRATGVRLQLVEVGHPLPSPFVTPARAPDACAQPIASRATTRGRDRAGRRLTEGFADLPTIPPTHPADVVRSGAYAVAASNPDADAHMPLAWMTSGTKRRGRRAVRVIGS
jgi:hypothetical protein